MAHNLKRITGAAIFISLPSPGEAHPEVLTHLFFGDSDRVCHPTNRLGMTYTTFP
jgi:hypothetical protein